MAPPAPRRRRSNLTTTEPAVHLEVAAAAGLRAQITGAVATITLDRPAQLNAQTPHTWSALTQVQRELPGTVRVVVLRGAGRSFSAGLDRAMFTPQGVEGAPGVIGLTAMSASEAADRIGEWQQGFDWSSRAGFVSIAAVQGHAIGAGFQLALGADIRILTDDATLTMAEAKLGMVPDLGGTKRLVDLVGYSRAAEICLTARPVDADEALRIGLASHVVAAADLDDAVERTVAALLAVHPDASAETKALLQGAAGRTQQEQQLAEREAQYRRLRALVGLDSES